jgi:hypothetical protein
MEAVQDNVTVQRQPSLEFKAIPVRKRVERHKL